VEPPFCHVPCRVTESRLSRSPIARSSSRPSPPSRSSLACSLLHSSRIVITYVCSYHYCSSPVSLSPSSRMIPISRFHMVLMSFSRSPLPRACPQDSAIFKTSLFVRCSSSVLKSTWIPTFPFSPLFVLVVVHDVRPPSSRHRVQCRATLQPHSQSHESDPRLAIDCPVNREAWT
jgi:hypothetical protein